LKLIKSSEIQVGDFLLINEGEIFPADLILLNSSLPDGTAYIQTSSLDGEKNLKKRVIPKNIDK
jgi:P-type E1-E2 ATPase